MARVTAETDIQTQIITGITEEDRHHFQRITEQQYLADANATDRVFRLDLQQIEKMNLVTLGLIAWIQQEMQANNCQVEFINATETTQDILQMFELGGPTAH